MKGHWNKYKLQYLFFLSYIILLLIFIISDQKQQKRINKLEKMYTEPLKEDNFDKKINENILHGDTKNNFIFPNPKNQNKNWLEKIYQKEVREQFRENIFNEKLLQKYETKIAPQKSRNIIIYGPPGTGKSLYARLVAQNESCVFTEFGAGELQEPWVGSAKNKWNDILEQTRKQLAIAKKNPMNKDKIAMIIINEIDSMLIKSKSNQGAGKIDNSLPDSFLQSVDSIQLKGEEIMIIGTTNYLNLIEKATIRPGRFAAIIEVKHPENLQELTDLFTYIETQNKRFWKTKDNKELWDKDNSDKSKIINFSYSFWKNILSITNKMIEKYKEYKIGFSFVDLNDVIRKCIIKKISENSGEIVPDERHYEIFLNRLITDKLKQQ